MHSTHRTAHPSTPELPESPDRSPRRWTRIAAAGAAVLACGAFTAGPALANSSGEQGSPVAVEWSHQHRRHAGGTIAAISGTDLVVTQRDGSALTVTTSDATTITATMNATLTDVTAGSFVTVRVRVADDGSMTAKRISMRPAPVDGSDATVWGGWKSWRGTVTGVVQAHDPVTGTLTITTDEGPVSVGTTDDTKVTRTVTRELAELTVGTNVWLKGSFADDATFAATRIQVLASSVGAPPATTEPPPTTAPPATDTPAPGDDQAEDSEDGSSPSNSRYQGIVQSLDGTTFALTLRDGSTVTVVTSDTTEFRTKAWSKGDDEAPASFVDVTVGAWVKVKGTLDGTTLLAEKVTVGPQRGAHDGDRRGEGDEGGQQRWDGGSRRDHDHTDDRDEDWSSSDRQAGDAGKTRGFSGRDDEGSSQPNGGSGRR